jgi:hypothetical protein
MKYYPGDLTSITKSLPWREEVHRVNLSCRDYCLGRRASPRSCSEHGIFTVCRGLLESLTNRNSTTPALPSYSSRGNE